MKTVLLLLVIAVLLIGARFWMRRGIAPAPRETAAGEEQALIVTFPVASTDDVKRIHALEDELSAAIKRSSAGEFDGDEVGNGNCVLYMYGPSAERLFQATIQLLRDFHPPAGSYLLKRFGKPGARQERVDLS